MERRTFLGFGVAVIGLAGCTGESRQPTAPSPPPEPPVPSDPDARLRDEVAASESALIAAYRSAIQVNPELAADLAPFVSQHEAHLDRVAPRFTGRTAFPDSSVPDSSTSSSADSSTSDPSDRFASPDASASSVLATLATSESAAQIQRATACDGAQDPGLARDLCLIAASEAQHARVLEKLAARETES